MDQGLNALDIGLSILLVFGLAHGLIKGFVWQAIRLAGMIAGLLLARAFNEPIAQMLQHNIVDLGPSVNVAVAYVLIFVAALGVCTIIARLLKGMVEKIELSGFDRLIGGAFGAFKMCVYSFLAILLVQAWVVEDDLVGEPPQPDSFSGVVAEQVRTSRLLPLYDGSAALIKKSLPPQLVNKWDALVEWTRSQGPAGHDDPQESDDQDLKNLAPRKHEAASAVREDV